MKKLDIKLPNYVTLSKHKVVESYRCDAVVDYDRNGRVVGVEILSIGKQSLQSLRIGSKKRVANG